jgi:hypothetical protein
VGVERGAAPEPAVEVVVPKRGGRRGVRSGGHCGIPQRQPHVGRRSRVGHEDDHLHLHRLLLSHLLLSLFFLFFFFATSIRKENVISYKYEMRMPRIQENVFPSSFSLLFM